MVTLFEFSNSLANALNYPANSQEMFLRSVLWGETLQPDALNFSKILR